MNTCRAFPGRFFNIYNMLAYNNVEKSFNSLNSARFVNYSIPSLNFKYYENTIKGKKE